MPFVWAGVKALNRDLGANPIEAITHLTGTWTLVFLLVGLSLTPLRQLSGLNWLIRLRRLIGLYAFFYALLHFTTYIWLDQFFDLASVSKDIFKRPFITVGFAGFVLLIPLALTSTKAAIRYLSGKRWQQLHRVVYVCAICGAVHYLWLVKADITLPVVYGCVLAVLLSYRVVRKFWSSRSLRTI